jgi:hypothetical protein
MEGQHEDVARIGRYARLSGNWRPRPSRSIPGSSTEQLRGSGAVLTYDPDTRTIRASGHHAVAVTTG